MLSKYKISLLNQLSELNCTDAEITGAMTYSVIQIFGDLTTNFRKLNKIISVEYLLANEFYEKIFNYKFSNKLAERCDEIMEYIDEKIREEKFDEIITSLPAIFETNDLINELVKLTTTHIENEIYLSTDPNTLIDSKQEYSRIIINEDLMKELKKIVEHINIKLECLIDRDNTKHIKKNQQKIIDIDTVEAKHTLVFSGLFKPEYRNTLNIFIDRLKINGYIDGQNKWIFKNNTNEPAKLFHYLKDRHVINETKFKPAIECFYNEFGCEVVEKDNGNPRATTRKNAADTKNSVNDSEFNNFLLSWINKK